MARNYITVSFNVGSKKHAIQNKEKLKKINNHNNRKFKKSYNEDLDLSKSKENVILIGTKNIVKDVEKLYKEEFSEAVYNYNSKQKRADRKIIDYLDKVSEDSKKNIALEIIMQVGDREDWEAVSMEEKKKMNEVFKKGLEVLEAKGIKVANAVIHYDEASPHLHLVGVPIASGFKTGMEKQVSTKAVLDKKKLYELREVIDKTLVDEYNKVYNKNLEKRKEKGIIEKHLDPANYKEVKKVVDELVKVADKNSVLTKVKENLSNKDKEIKELKEKAISKDEKILEYNNFIKSSDEDIEKAKKEAEEKEKEKEEAEAIVKAKTKELEEARRNAINIDNLIMEEKEKKQEIENKKQEIEKLNNNYKELQEKIEAEKDRIKEEIEAEREEIKKNIDKIIEEKEKEKAVLKEKEKELQDLRENKANIDEAIEKEKKEKINNKEEVLKILDKRIEDLSKDIGKRKEKIEEAEAEEQTIIKREKELEEKREERVLKNREKTIYEAIEYLENENINLNEKDYFFRKVPYLEENLFEKDKGLFVGYVTNYFQTIKSNLMNYTEKYREILKEIKTEVLQGARAFNNFVRETYHNIELDEEKTISVKEKVKEKASDEKEKEKVKEKDDIEY
jgi:plasmid recombination enzyme